MSLTAAAMRLLADKGLNLDEVVRIAGNGCAAALSAAVTKDNNVCIYIFAEDGDAYCKIGISENPGYRLYSIQVCNPRTLRLAYHTAGYPRRIATKIEQAAHAAFSAHRVRGEWFSCPVDEAAQVIDALAAKFFPETEQCQ